MKNLKSIYKEVFDKMSSSEDKNTMSVENDPMNNNGVSDGINAEETMSPPAESGDAGDSAQNPNGSAQEVEGETTEEEPTEAELTPEGRIAELEGQLAAAQAKADEHFDRLQRTTAEFQNTKRRQEKLLSDSIERASGRLVERILPVLDDFDLALKNLPDEIGAEEHPWVIGLQQIQKKLLQLLEDEGVSVIPHDGPFDPNRHEAVSSEPSEEIESGHIIETLRAGYQHKERVLRPALVRVAM